MKTKDIKLWWSIIRPKTLFASVCPVIAGILLCHAEKKACGISSMSCTAYFILCAILLLCSVSLQVLSNLINDYYDYKKGTDKKGRIGFKRALAEGTVSINQMRNAIYITLAIALLTGLVLIIKGGLPILLIGITAILFAWLYTATRFSLSYLGIADIFCFLYYGIFAVAGTVYLLIDGGSNWNMSNMLHTTHYILHTTSIWCVGAVCGLISMTVLMINNIRDIDDDRNAGKKTLPVRLGKKTCEYILLIYSLLMLASTFAVFGLSFTNLIFIPAFMLYQEVVSAQGDAYNKCLFKAGKLNLFFTVLLCLEVLL
ncbi:MAG: 1,4-dihydroxy-2-naphthoate octaprenyltransferase [Bacteroidales bacterium]|nr:1,4-dihydroxy-2-naphthoate octaprenyltransferase [Bacteroidales bacterium]